MNKRQSSNSGSSRAGEQSQFDVTDAPTLLLELQFYAQEIQRISQDPEVRALAQKIEQGQDQCVSAIAAAVDQLAELEEVA